MPLRRAERGVVLLDALVALAILASAGVTLVGVLGAALHDEAIARQREITLAQAHRVLAATTLLARGELDQRIGRHEVGDWVVAIERPEPTLYRVAIAAADAPEVEQLVTVVFRSEPGNAP